jgi:hypothetical protein
MRLTLFTKLMFTSFVILMAFLTVVYQAYPSYKPPNNELIFGGGAVALAVMAAVWRLGLVRRALSFEALYRIDLVYALCIGSAFALSAALAYPLRPAAYRHRLRRVHGVHARSSCRAAGRARWSPRSSFVHARRRAASASRPGRVWPGVRGRCWC